MDPQFEADEIAITPLGPRGRDWLYETAQEGNKGRISSRGGLRASMLSTT